MSQGCINWRQVAVVISWIWIPAIPAVLYDLFRIVSWAVGASPRIWG